MHFVVDSKNPNYQLIHYDMTNHHGIECKFANFREENGVEKFDITHYRRLIVLGEYSYYQPIKDIKTSIIVNQETHKYQLNVDLPPGDHVISDERDCKRNVFICKSSEGAPFAEHIINVHIEESGDIPIAGIKIRSTHGPGISKFYIV